MYKTAYFLAIFSLYLSISLTIHIPNNQYITINTIYIFTL